MFKRIASRILLLSMVEVVVFLLWAREVITEHITPGSVATALLSLIIVKVSVVIFVEIVSALYGRSVGRMIFFSSDGGWLAGLAVWLISVLICVGVFVTWEPLTRAIGTFAASILVIPSVFVAATIAGYLIRKRNMKGAI